tara:strand:+ start:1158 stop:1409 length:252 start_codon:yes stop_codon:yes gene_type:complete
MAKTREELNAYQRAYYKKNKTRIQAQQAVYREKNGIESPGFIAPRDVNDAEWKSISNKLFGSGIGGLDEQSGFGAFDWEDIIE